MHPLHMELYIWHYYVHMELRHLCTCTYGTLGTYASFTYGTPRHLCTCTYGTLGTYASFTYGTLGTYAHVHMEL